MTCRIVLNGNENNWLIGIGERDLLEVSTHYQSNEIDQFLGKHTRNHIFSIISYDLGFEILPVIQQKKKRNYPLLRLWQAEAVYRFNGHELSCIEGNDTLQNRQLALECVQEKQIDLAPFHWNSNQSKASYIEAVNQLKHRIQLGDIYEINYCQEFTAPIPQGIDLIGIYQRLNHATPTPFSVFFESEKFALVSASPERFIQKNGNRLISQPIKGTAPRGTTPEQDEALSTALKNNSKERSENIMIVDLVRNDCSRIASKGSVKVDELCGLYSFPTVHQLISTISCTLKPNTLFSEILQALFPMGSMTGAPKVAAINLAEEIEPSAREWYSGSVGIIYPSGDFDFNVIIRSICFNRVENCAKVGVGGAITIHSNPESEYEECRVKVGKILDLFGSCLW